MSIISFFRIIKLGVVNFWRNIWLSVATTFIMVLTLFLISTLVIINIIGNIALDTVKEKVDISVFLNSETTEAQINQVKNKLLSLSEVKSIDYITKEQALKEFKEKHKGEEKLLASIEELEMNPLESSLIVKAKNPEDYALISEALSDDKFKDVIRKVTFEDNKRVIDRLTSISSTVEKAIIGISFVFGFIAVIMVFNTIRMTIYSQREEIKIMKLVGATNSFVRTPFILEGSLYGIFGSLLSCVVLYPLLHYFSPRINAFLEYQGVDIFTYFTEHIIIIMAIQMVLGVLLGVISSYIAIRKYLRV